MLTLELNKKADIYLGKKWLQQVATAFAGEYKLKKSSYFSLAFVNGKIIRQLNRTYRGKDKVTDVLSFCEDDEDFIEMPSRNEYLGEVVICVERAREQAYKFGHSLKREVARLLVHGLAHLVGYDHERVSAKKVKEMEEFEEKVLLRVFKF